MAVHHVLVCVCFYNHTPFPTSAYMCLHCSLVATGLTAAGLRGNAFIFAQCGALAFVMAPLVAGVSSLFICCVV